MHRRNLWITVLGLLIIGGVTAYKIYNKKHVDVIKASAYKTISANELVDAFNLDEDKATEEYLDKVIEVSGIVADVETNNGVSTVYLQSSDLLKSVSCEIDGGVNEAINVGDHVQIRGICAGSLMDVVLVQCKIVKAN